MRFGLTGVRFWGVRLGLGIWGFEYEFLGFGVGVRDVGLLV